MHKFKLLNLQREMISASKGKCFLCSLFLIVDNLKLHMNFPQKNNAYRKVTHIAYTSNSLLWSWLTVERMCYRKRQMEGWKRWRKIINSVLEESRKEKGDGEKKTKWERGSQTARVSALQVTRKGKVGCESADQSKPSHVESAGSDHMSAGTLPPPSMLL